MPQESPLTVLIVEDHPELADLYREFIPDGFSTSIAYSADEALDYVDPSLDVLILDRELGDHSGRTVLDHVQSKHVDCKVIIVSGYDESMGEPLEHDAYLKKPVNGATLVKKLRLVSL